MYKFLTRIPSPAAYGFGILPDGSVLIRDTRGVKLLDDQSYRYGNDQPLDHLLFDNKIIITDWAGKYSIFDFQSWQQILSGVNQGFFLVNDEYLGTAIIDNGKISFGLLNRDLTLAEQWPYRPYSYFNQLVQKNWILLDSYEKCYALSIGDQGKQWEFSFSTAAPAQFSAFAGQYGQLVAITLNNGSFLLNDAETGKLRQQFNNTNVTTDMLQYAPGSPRFLGVGFETFIEINIEQNKVIRKIDFTQSLQQLAGETVFMRKAKIYGNKLYFIAGTNHIGVFDIETARIEWLHKFKFKSRNTLIPVDEAQIQLYQNKLFVMDNAGDLHVFEQQNTP
ncbi:hypothetical protein [Paraflavitalea pollutisoli]|uniref:hypothetical protein n=1 Tax=Paraflavitalea pollutisoli TaxID=3034143 RepID=UPI0023EE1BFD|nr:hypothetical protein [Paraflavitalea sp. H1-2-19X]